MKAKVNIYRTFSGAGGGALWRWLLPSLGVGLSRPERRLLPLPTIRYKPLVPFLGATAIPPSSPYGINDLGHVVGNAAHSSFTYCEWGYCSEYVVGHAFLYDGAMKDFGRGGIHPAVPLT